MDWRVFPLSLKEEFDSYDEIYKDIEERLKDSHQKLLDTMTLTDKDYTTSEDTKEDVARLATEFKYQLHGVRNYKILSDNVLFIKFLSEIEDEANDLYATYRRYNEHNTRVKIPPRFSKPFFVYLKDYNRGVLLAPAGTPQRVEYIMTNDLSKILGANFSRERFFEPRDMDSFLDLVNGDDNRIKGISSISAQVTDKDGLRRSYSTSMTNIGDYTQLKDLKDRYEDFRLYQIVCKIQYGGSAVTNLANLTIRSQGGKPPISAGADSRKIESKKDLVEWVGKLLC
ncbi:MAG: hypothetical protein M0Q13_03205 [Methanothrix sp.]|jgi:hypothetical protein|nr:hypothetical protein [Methanothrix sp.]